MENRDQLHKTLLTPSEASARLNVPLRTIYFWHRTGRIKGVNVNGKCLRIFSESVSELLRSKPGMSSKKGSARRKRNAKGTTRLARRNKGDIRCSPMTAMGGAKRAPESEG